ncbi:putative pyroglutamyl-peptidase 1 [Trichinella spiralis]|uniref:putative pyroglutamyl-peptidase 1 n=1 Tax=Trichinella spiralis TaxID=6334 RepID=UPI0001EFEB19|nr:putative pyroglutamyl-peptidase 1 [Trichinella spiralis]
MSASNLVIISFLICTIAIINIHGELDILQYAKQTIYASDLKKPDQNFRKVVSVDSSTAAGEDIVSITIHAKETTCAVSQQISIDKVYSKECTVSTRKYEDIECFLTANSDRVGTLKSNYKENNECNNFSIPFSCTIQFLFSSISFSVVLSSLFQLPLNHSTEIMFCSSNCTSISCVAFGQTDGLTKVGSTLSFAESQEGRILPCKRHFPYKLLKCFSYTIYSNTSRGTVSFPIYSRPN